LRTPQRVGNVPRQTLRQSSLTAETLRDKGGPVQTEVNAHATWLMLLKDINVIILLDLSYITSTSTSLSDYLQLSCI